MGTVTAVVRRARHHALHGLDTLAAAVQEEDLLRLGSYGFVHDIGVRQDELLTLYLYDHLPAIHGFRVENDDVFCSYIHREGDKLAKPFHFYEHFAATNRSVRARHYRLLFENWLERARAGKSLP